MATFTFTSVADQFPVGTSVGAYLARYRRNDSSPSGSAATTATVASSGSLEFTGLADDTEYVAYASVSGAHRYRNFQTSRPRYTGQEIVGPLTDGDAPVWSTADDALVATPVADSSEVIADGLESDIATVAADASKTLRPLRRDWVNTEEFSGTPAQKIAAAAAACAAQNRKILRLRPNADYEMTTQASLTAALAVNDLVIEGEGAKLIVDGTIGGGLFAAAGTEGAWTELDTNVAARDQDVPLPTGAGTNWARGDIFQIESESVVYDNFGHPSELREVLEVDGDDLTLSAPLKYAHTTANNARVRKLTGNGLTFRGLTVQNTDPTAQQAYAGVLRALRGIRFDDVVLDDAGGGFLLYDCYDIAGRVTVKALPNYGDSYGYGVALAGACTQADLTINGRACRHLYTTLANERTPTQQGGSGYPSDPNSSNGNYFVGGPQMVKVRGVGQGDPGCTAVYDMHEFGETDFDVETRGGIVGLQIRGRATGRIIARNASLAGVNLIDSSKDCDLYVDVQACGGDSGDKGVADAGTDNRVRGRIRDCLGPGYIASATAVRPTLDGALVQNNADYGVQDQGATGLTVENCRIPQSAAQTVACLNLSASAVVRNSDCRGYGSGGFSGLTAGAKLVDVLTDTGLITNVAHVLSVPGAAITLDKLIYGGGTDLIRTDSVLRTTEQLQVDSLKIDTGTAAPTTGANTMPHIVLNSEPASGEPIGWVLTANGTPGTWAAFGTIA